MPPILESHFQVMGGAAHLVVVGGDESMLQLGRKRLEDLEERWSRFRTHSEISRLNRAGGRPCRVSSETVALVQRALTGWAATSGAFDPTVFAAIRAAGYTTSFPTLPTETRGGAVPGPAPGCAGIIADPSSRLVVLPPGTGFDPGGIGKGLAADMLAEELIAAGAAGACVNVGGDIRTAGVAPGPDGWVIGIEDPRDPSGRRELDRLRIGEGAVATSSVLLKSWQHEGRPVHHLIDPSTGLPSDSVVVAVTAITGAGWWSEVMTKAALMAGPAAVATLERHGADGLVVTADGRTLTTAGVDSYRFVPLPVGI